jgi:hypothetical protein
MDGDLSRRVDQEDHQEYQGEEWIENIISNNKVSRKGSSLSGYQGEQSREDIIQDINESRARRSSRISR